MTEMKKKYIIPVFIACASTSFFTTKLLKENSKTEDDTIHVVKPIIDVRDTIPDTIPAPIPSPPGTDTVVVVPDTIVPPRPVPRPVNITNEEVKNLIITGRYDLDQRIARRYRIEYLDVNDDDMEGLQQNLTSVQNMVEFGNWRDIEVAGLGFERLTGKVNLVKIRPVY